MGYLTVLQGSYKKFPRLCYHFCTYIFIFCKCSHSRIPELLFVFVKPVKLYVKQRVWTLLSLGTTTTTTTTTTRRRITLTKKITNIGLIRVNTLCKWFVKT